jgi:8-oxoguanine deaminase
MGIAVYGSIPISPRQELELMQQQVGMTTEAYCQEYEWIGDDVWHAHCIHLTDSEIDLFARTGTGVAHCPHSNMRLGFGIARIPKMFRAGVRVGLGVDGSASNDGGHMIAETRQALMLARIGTSDPAALTVREILEVATRGGAAVLGRDDVGYLAPGTAADFVAINLNRLGYAGGWQHDALASVILCTPVNVDYSVINGRVIVREGQLTTIDLRPVVERQNRFARQLITQETSARGNR